MGGPDATGTEMFLTAMATLVALAILAACWWWRCKAHADANKNCSRGSPRINYSQKHKRRDSEGAIAPASPSIAAINEHTHVEDIVEAIERHSPTHESEPMPTAGAVDLEDGGVCVVDIENDAGCAVETGWIQRVAQGVGRIRRAPITGEIDTASYLAAMAPIPDIYDTLLSLQVVTKFMRRDFEAHHANVRRSMVALPEGMGSTLEGIVRYGMANYRRDELARNPSSMVGGVLWMHRCAKFVTHFIRGLVDGKTSSNAAKDAYKGLRPYHNMLTAAFVGRALALTPKRQHILQRLEFESEAAAQASMQELLAGLEPLVVSIEASLDAMGANFPEKV